jgi:hypothetical protein
MTEPRDQFALEAMKILLTAALDVGMEHTSKDMAAAAYELADSTMKARG